MSRGNIGVMGGGAPLTRGELARTREANKDPSLTLEMVNLGPRENRGVPPRRLDPGAPASEQGAPRLETISPAYPCAGAHGLVPGERFRAKINIPLTGTRTADFEFADRRAKIQRRPDEVWHHSHDYDPATNQNTMYLMKKSDHDNLSHTGGCAQYKSSKGHGY